MKKIPKRPNNNKRYTLSQNEINCLNYYCVFQCAKIDAFKAFVSPELVISKFKLKEATEQFFAMSEVKDYIYDYNKTLQELFSETKPVVLEESDEAWEEKKQQALRNLADKGYRLAENLDAEDADIDLVVKVFDKLGWLDNEEVQVEQPRRYLPETCHSSCRYRAFCEQECEDLCQYCKYKKFGEENGVHYESEKQLEMPQQSDTPESGLPKSDENNNKPKGENNNK